MSFCGCVLSTWRKNDSDPHCLLVHTSSVSWLLSEDRFSHADGSSQVFSAHVLCNAKCHPPSCTLLQCLRAIVLNSWDICIPTHPFLHCMLIFRSFGSLPIQSQVSNSLLKFCSQGGFFTIFVVHFFCSALCQPCASAAVSASNSDQPLRTLHSTHLLLHDMLIFCSPCCLPSQSQRSNSLLKLCLEALFGAQSRVALPRRGCFQALLSGCTILRIISCSSLARFKYLQMAVNMDGPRCTEGGMLVLYLFGISKNLGHFSPFPQGRRLVHHVHSGMSRHHQVGYIIFT